MSEDEIEISGTDVSSVAEQIAANYSGGEVHYALEFRPDNDLEYELKQHISRPVIVDYRGDLSKPSKGRYILELYS